MVKVLDVAPRGDGVQPSDFGPRAVRKLAEPLSAVEQGVRDLIDQHYVAPRSATTTTQEAPMVDRFAIQVSKMPCYDLRTAFCGVCELPGYKKDQWPSPIELTEMLSVWAHDHLEPPPAAQPEPPKETPVETQQ